MQQITGRLPHRTSAPALPTTFPRNMYKSVACETLAKERLPIRLSFRLGYAWVVYTYMIVCHSMLEVPKCHKHILATRSFGILWSHLVCTPNKSTSQETVKISPQRCVKAAVDGYKAWSLVALKSPNLEVKIISMTSPNISGT